MRCFKLSLPVAYSLAVIRLLSAQGASKVDFGKDVLPILRQNCVTCHSGTQPASGMRLDRKSAVISRRGVVPGSAENCFLFYRISGNDYGMQMPPTGALKPEQIDTIKRWIEQGATSQTFSSATSWACSREGDSVQIAVHGGVDVGVARRVGAGGQFGSVNDSGPRNYAAVRAWLDAARGKLRQGFAGPHGNRQASPMTLSRREFDWDI